MKERLLWILNLPAGLVWISWESCLIQCLLLQFWETFAFRSQKVWGESANLFPGVWPVRVLVSSLIGAFQWDWRVFLESLPTENISGLKGLDAKALYPELTVERLLGRAWLFLMEAVRVFKILKYISFYQLWIKRSKAGFIGYPVTISKGESLWGLKRWTWNLEGPIWQFFWPGYLKGLYDCQLRFNSADSTFN